MSIEGLEMTKEQRAKFFPALEDMRKAQDKPVWDKCLFGPDACASRPIGSHLLSRAWLSLIADKTNHVLQLHPNQRALTEPGHNFLARPVSINEATKFPGFCQSHDNRLFECLEKQIFVASQRQFLALAYRSVCREFCIKWQMVGCHLPKAYNPDSHPEITALTTSEMKRCIRLLAYKLALEELMLANGSVASLVVRFAQRPSVLVSVTFHHVLTFTGRLLERRTDWITLSIIPDEVGGWAVFSWDKRSPKNAALLAKSFTQVSPHLQTVALLNLVFEVSESHAMTPLWWKSLEERRRVEVIRRFTGGALTGDPHRPARLLVPEGKPWADWQPVESHFV